MSATIEQCLKEITERHGEITPCFDREMHEYIAHARQDIPFLLTLVNHYRSELSKIAKPALGGKEQQWRAAEALKFKPEAACQ